MTNLIKVCIVKITIGFIIVLLWVKCFCSQVTRVVLLWVNNHFNDFEGDPEMTHFLEEFESNLEREVSVFTDFSFFFYFLSIQSPHCWP